MCAKYVIKEKECREKQDEVKAIEVQRNQVIVKNKYLNDQLENITKEKDR